MTHREIVLVVVIAVLAVALVALAVQTRRYPRRLAARTGRRVLVPFAGRLDQTVLDAAIRIARADEATLVPAYLVIVPLEYDVDAALKEQVQIAMPLLEAVERAALSAGVPVDARIEKGRTLTHALRLLWEAEGFDRIVAPATTNGHGGFGAKDLTWLLANAPAETLVLKPYTPAKAPLDDAGEPEQRPSVIRGARV